MHLNPGTEDIQGQIYLLKQTNKKNSTKKKPPTTQQTNKNKRQETYLTLT